MWAERLPCRLSTPSQAHLQGPQRLWREAYHRCSCCLITFFLSSLLPLSISGCHSHLHSFPTPSFIYLSLFQCCFPFSTLIFPRFVRKRTQMAPKARSRKMESHTQTAHSRANRSPFSVATPHLWPSLILLLLLSLLTRVFVDHQSMNSGWFVDQSNLPTETLCKCRSSCLAHAIGLKGQHDKEASSEGCAYVTEAKLEIEVEWWLQSVAIWWLFTILKWQWLSLMRVTL